MEFDRKKLKILPLDQREHLLNLDTILSLSKAGEPDKIFRKISQEIIKAKSNNSSVILIIGAHVIRSGVQRYIIDLMKNGYISCIAMNGACLIHDYEFALIGATTESVPKYIVDGKFGLWKETGDINDIIKKGYENKKGMGEIAGEEIEHGDFPYKDISILAAGFRYKVPVTVHVGIGYDIIHQHPNCDGAAVGYTSYKDFLIFTKVVENLNNGVLMSFGSAVMAPEVFLKALSMARNSSSQIGQSINKFTTLVCDLYDLPEDVNEFPDNDKAGYYFRPWKTLLVRTVKDGGKGYYKRGFHKETFPALWSSIIDNDQGGNNNA